MPAETPTQEPLIIALHGPSGVGKDWVARHLFQSYGTSLWGVAYPFKAWLIADLAEVHGLSIESAIRAVWFKRSPSIRLQLIGGRTAHARNAYGEDVFARMALLYLAHDSIRHPASRGGVVTDLRTGAEAAAFLRAGGTVIHIEPKAQADLRDIGQAGRTTIEQGAHAAPEGSVVLVNDRDNPEETYRSIGRIVPRPPASTDETFEHPTTPSPSFHSWAFRYAAENKDIESYREAVKTHLAGPGNLPRGEPGEASPALAAAWDWIYLQRRYPDISLTSAVAKHYLAMARAKVAPPRKRSPAAKGDQREPGR